MAHRFEIRRHPVLFRSEIVEFFQIFAKFYGIYSVIIFRKL